MNFDKELDIIKAEEAAIGVVEKEWIAKGKPAVPVGTIRDVSGRKYIKVANGWKYYGKGGGAKAQEHQASSASKTAGGVGPGHKITAPNGVTGKVTKVEDGHVHIEHTDKDGQVQTSKVPQDQVDSKIKEGKFQHDPSEGFGGSASQDSGEKKSAPKAEAEEAPMSESEKKKQELIAANQNVDVNKRFAAFARFTKAVINGSSKSMIAYGTGGVGKTYTVTQQLAAAGKKPFDKDNMQPGDDDYDYVKLTGKMTAPQVYKALYEHNGKILLFDDIDSVLRDSNSINLFKGALDTSGDGTIEYGTSSGVKGEDGEKLPSSFKFSGRAMFISNLPPDQVPQPLKSRSLYADLTMTSEQTMERIRHIAKDKDGKYQNLKFPGLNKYSHEDLSGVIDYLDDHKDITADLNVRTIGKLLAIKQMADSEGVDWKEDANHMIFSKGEEDNLYDGSTIRKARKINIAKSYGIDLKKAMNCKSSDVKSKFNKSDDMEDDEVEKSEDSQLSNEEVIDLSKAFDTLMENNFQK